MSEKKTPCSDVAALEQGKREVQAEKPYNSQSNCSNSLPENQARLWAVLLLGHENAQTAAELARVLKWAPRQVTRTIQQLRRNGKPIAACCLDNNRRGYYIADRDELRRYLCGLLRRIGEIKKTADATAETLERMDE